MSFFADVISTCVDVSKIFKTDTELLTYVAGYCASNIKTNCSACIAFCMTEKELLVEMYEGSSETIYAYIVIINRGSLKYPTEDVVLVVSLTYLMFQTLF